jgi:hypothetical protein
MMTKPSIPEMGTETETETRVQAEQVDSIPTISTRARNAKRQAELHVLEQHQALRVRTAAPTQLNSPARREISVTTVRASDNVKLEKPSASAEAFLASVRLTVEAG